MCCLLDDEGAAKSAGPAPASGASTLARHEFYDAHKEDCDALLEGMFAAISEESPEGWQMLRFAGVPAAANWAVALWLSDRFSPESIGWDADLVPPELVTFSLADFWQLYRLAELQEKDLAEERSLERETGRSRLELNVKKATYEGLATGPSGVRRNGSPLADAQSSSTNFLSRLCAGNGEARLEKALSPLIDRILDTLMALGARIHTVLPLLWLVRQVRVRKSLEHHLGTGLFRGVPALPSLPVLEDLSASQRTKAASLALFRFSILFESLPLRAAQKADAAFMEIYLSNVEHPTWSPRPRDRWDLMPKSVAATRLKARGLALSPNEVASLARERLCGLVGNYLSLVRDRLDPDDFEATAEDALVRALRLVLARDSITLTLRDEYARADRPNAQGPSSEVIQDWHEEINQTLEDLRRHIEQTLEECA